MLTIDGVRLNIYGVLVAFGRHLEVIKLTTVVRDCKGVAAGGRHEGCMKDERRMEGREEEGRQGDKED